MVVIAVSHSQPVDVANAGPADAIPILGSDARDGHEAEVKQDDGVHLGLELEDKVLVDLGNVRAGFVEEDAEAGD